MTNSVYDLQIGDRVQGVWRENIPYTGSVKEFGENEKIRSFKVVVALDSAVNLYGSERSEIMVTVLEDGDNGQRIELRHS